MVNAIFREIHKAHEVNSAVAAAAQETLADTLEHRRKFGPFNSLIVKHADAVPIEIRLDGLTEEGYIFRLSPGDTLIIGPEDGIMFSFLTVVNLSATTAQVINKTLYRWARAEVANGPNN